MGKLRAEEAKQSRTAGSVGRKNDSLSRQEADGKIEEASAIVADVTEALNVLAKMIERAHSPQDEGNLTAGELLGGVRVIVAATATLAKEADEILDDVMTRR